MSNNFFEDESENDLGYMSQEESEALEQKIIEAPLPISKQQFKDAIPESVYEDLREEGYEVFSDEELENDEELLTDVSLRLEQGQLYQMILKHDLFENVDATPKAIANVQREIRQHIKGRLAVLLGIKPEIQTPQKRQDFPFTDVEVSLLKTLLAKLSGGATEKYKEVPEGIPKENKISAVVEKKPQTLKPLAAAKPVQKVAVNKPIPQASKPNRPLPSNPNKIKSKIEQIAEMEAELQANYKPFAEMTQQEREERNLRVSKLEALKKVPRPSNAIPMPSFDSINMMNSVAADNNTKAMLSGRMGKALK